MGYRFQHQLQVDHLSDPMLDNAWEVIMPPVDLTPILEQVPGNPLLTPGDFQSFGAGMSGAKNYSPIVEQIVFAPAGYRNSQDIRAITNFYNIPEDREDAKEATLTFYCDTSMLPQYYIAAWKNCMFNYVHEFYYMPHQYKKDIVVLLYGASDSMATVKYTLKGCYPLLQSDFELSYTRTPKRMKLTHKFNVDRVVIDVSYLKAGLGYAALKNPLSNMASTIAGNVALSGLTLSGSTADNALTGVPVPKN